MGALEAIASPDNVSQAELDLGTIVAKPAHNALTASLHRVEFNAL